MCRHCGTHFIPRIGFGTFARPAILFVFYFFFVGSMGLDMYGLSQFPGLKKGTAFLIGGGGPLYF